MNASHKALQPVVTSPEKLLAYAHALVPTLKDRAVSTSKLGKLPDETISDLEAGGLLSMTTPRKYGGLQVSVSTFLDVVAELGRGDAAVAWITALINVTTWAAAVLYGEKVADEVFGGEQPARVVGVLSARKAVVKKVEGGYLIEEGLWGFNSGIYHANWDLLGIPIVDAAGNVIDQGAALVRASDVEILGDWDVIALRGTGSSSVSVKNLFVPDERVASMSRAVQGDYQATHLAGEALYRVALVPMLALILTFPALGVASAALEVFLEQLPRRGIQYTWYTKQSEAPLTHLQVGEASAKFDAARAIIEKHARLMDESAESGNYMAFLDRAKVRRDIGFAEKLIWEGVDLLATAAGGSLAATHNPFTKLWQDARVASLHGIVSQTTNFELYGRLACGLPPNTPLI